MTLGKKVFQNILHYNNMTYLNKCKSIYNKWHSKISIRFGIVLALSKTIILRFFIIYFKML